MDLAEIKLRLDEVDERHEEAECILAEVRERDEVEEVYGMLDACEDTLEEISSVIDYVKAKLQEGADASGPAGVQFCDGITPLLIQLLKVGWKQEQLEDAHEALSRACR